MGSGGQGGRKPWGLRGRVAETTSPGVSSSLRPWLPLHCKAGRRPGPCRRHPAAGPPLEAAEGQTWGARGGAGRRGWPHQHPGLGAHWGQRGPWGPGCERRRGWLPGGPMGAAPGGQLRLPLCPLPAASLPGRAGRPDPAGYGPRSWVQVPGGLWEPPGSAHSQGAHGGLSRVMREALAWEGTAPLALPGHCPERPWARSALGTGASPPLLSVVPTERQVRALGTTLDTLLGACSAPAGSHTSRGLCGQEDHWAEEGGGLPGVHHPPGPPH